MTPTAPMTAITSVFKLSSGWVTADVPVAAAKHCVLIRLTAIALPDTAGISFFLTFQKNPFIVLPPFTLFDVFAVTAVLFLRIIKSPSKSGAEVTPDIKR